MSTHGKTAAGKAGRGPRRQRGVTLVEMLVALFLVSIVTVAAGYVYLTNQRSFRHGREKLQAQQNLTWCVEEVARDLRRAWRVDHVNSQKIVLYDVDGFVFATWELGSEGGQNRLLRNGTAMAPEQCTTLQFSVAAPDTSAIGVDLELADATDNRVRLDSIVTLRNFEVAGPS